MVKYRNDIIKHFRGEAFRINLGKTEFQGDTFEIIIVNDGSRDETGDIVKHYVETREIKGKTINEYNF